MGPLCTVVIAVKGGRIGWQHGQAAVIAPPINVSAEMYTGALQTEWSYALSTARRDGNIRKALPRFARLGPGKKVPVGLQRTRNCFANGRENVSTLAIHERQVNGCLCSTGRTLVP